MMMQNYNADSYLQYLPQKKVNIFSEFIDNILIMFYLGVELFFLKYRPAILTINNRTALNYKYR